MKISQIVNEASYTTSSTILEKDTITLKDIERMVENLQKSLPPIPEEWVLISPTGKCMIAKPEELLRVLIAYHPLLKPMSLNNSRPFYYCPF